MRHDGELDLIEVIGGAGARLSTHLDWREPADLGDDEPGLASRASTVWNRKCFLI